VGPFAALGLPRPELVMETIRGIKDNALFTYLFQDNRTGLLRLPLFILWFGALFMLVRRYEGAVMKWAGWLLLPLGKNSLYVYILQSVVVFSITLLMIPQEYVMNSLINIVAVLICWVAVQRQFLFKIIPR
jgi:fucose 4-O-acetylase-like acetyltransferase